MADGAAGFEAVEFVQVRIGEHRRKLQNLVECGVPSGGFGMVVVSLPVVKVW